MITCSDSYSDLFRHYFLFGVTYKLVLPVVLICSNTSFVFVLKIIEYITLIKNRDKNGQTIVK
jgi:hypothetical protein